jgi:hypothetical protein
MKTEPNQALQPTALLGRGWSQTLGKEEYPVKSQLIVGGLPLLLYPFIAIASAMSLGGYSTGTERTLLMIVARGFQIGSLVYPLVYVGCLIAALVVRKKKESAAATIASVPLWFLGMVCLLFVSWLALDAWRRSPTKRYSQRRQAAVADLKRWAKNEASL